MKKIKITQCYICKKCYGEGCKDCNYQGYKK